MAEKILESLEIKTGENTSDKYIIPYNALANRPDLSVYAKLAGGNTFTGKQTLNSPPADGYSIDASGYVKGSWLQAPSTGKAGSNTGKVCVLDGSGWVYYRTPAEIVSDGGGATTSQIPTVNNGTLTIQKNGTNVQTFTANQSSSVTANITVPTKASDVNALSLDGGTINKSKTVKMDASANSNGANLKWGTVNSKNPYIGYASDQTDGTFVVGSLLGTNYASGLAISGGSGNLLWKGTKVATINDIPNVSGKANLSGGNTFTGDQHFNAGQYVFEVSNDYDKSFIIEDPVGNYFIAANADGFSFDDDQLGHYPFLIGGEAGTSGQVLTSQGAGKTPIWATPTSGGGGGSTAWSSGTSGSVKLPSAGLYVVVSDNFTFVVYWNGSGSAYSNSTYRSRNNQWVQTEIAYDGVIYVYAYKLDPFSKILQNETIKYRKIGEA